MERSIFSAICSHRARRLSLNSNVGGTSFKWLVLRRPDRPPVVAAGVAVVSVVLNPVDKPCTSVVARGGFVSIVANSGHTVPLPTSGTCPTPRPQTQAGRDVRGTRVWRNKTQSAKARGDALRQRFSAKTRRLGL